MTALQTEAMRAERHALRVIAAEAAMTPRFSCSGVSCASCCMRRAA